MPRTHCTHTFALHTPHFALCFARIPHHCTPCRTTTHFTPTPPPQPSTTPPDLPHLPGFVCATPTFLPPAARSLCCCLLFFLHASALLISGYARACPFSPGWQHFPTHHTLFLPATPPPPPCHAHARAWACMMCVPTLPPDEQGCQWIIAVYGIACSTRAATDFFPPACNGGRHILAATSLAFADGFRMTAVANRQSKRTEHCYWTWRADRRRCVLYLLTISLFGGSHACI